jgi:xylan 1,4-beta-xylosidase
MSPVAWNYRYLRIGREQEGGDVLLMLTTLVNGSRTERLCATTPKDRPAGSRLYLRLTVRERELRFFYSMDASAEQGLDAAVWVPAGPVLDTSELSDEFCKYGEFTGTFVGVACVDARSRSNYADFDWFEYQIPAHSAMPLSTGPSPLPFSVSE